jgi:hypothetical protein
MQESVDTLELETVKQRFRLEVRHCVTAWQAAKMRVCVADKLNRHNAGALPRENEEDRWRK